jgi:hypothetical protein
VREHVPFYECVLKILQQIRDAHVKHMSLADKHINAPPLAANTVAPLKIRYYVGENGKQQM